MGVDWGVWELCPVAFEEKAVSDLADKRYCGGVVGESPFWQVVGHQ